MADPPHSPDRIHSAHLLIWVHRFPRNPFEDTVRADFVSEFEIGLQELRPLSPVLIPCIVHGFREPHVS